MNLVNPGGTPLGRKRVTYRAVGKWNSHVRFYAWSTLTVRRFAQLPYGGLWMWHRRHVVVVPQCYNSLPNSSDRCSLTYLHSVIRKVAS